MLPPPHHLIVFFCFLMSLAGLASAQQQQTASRFDSLRSALKAPGSDTTAIKLYHLLAAEVSEDKPLLALAYEDSALVIAKKLKHPRHIAVTLTNIGAIHRKVSDYGKAYPCFQEAIAISPPSSPWLTQTYLEAGIALLRMSHLDSSLHVLEQGMALVEKHPDVYLEASLYNMMGNVKREQNQYEQALALYIRSIKLFEHIDNPQGLTQALSNVGNLHNLMGNTDKALGYALKSLEMAKVAGVKSSVAYSYRLIGRIYRKQGKPDSALGAYQQAAEIYRQILSRRDLGETGYSIGNIYYDKQDFGQALKHYRQSLSVLKTIPDTFMMSYVYVAAGMTEDARKKFGQARAYLDSGILLATKKNSATLLMDGYQVLAGIYEAEGNYAQGLRHYRKYIAIRDSITQVQNKLEAQEIEARYQGEKKDDAIRILNAENKLKSSQQLFLLILLGLVAILAAILYNRFKLKQRANEKLKELDQIKSRFFTNVSHEFRTPLSLILGPLEEKIAITSDPHEQENLQMMHRNARRLQHLTNQVLDLSRIEAGTLALHLEEGDVLWLPRFMASTFSSLAEHKGLFFKQEISSRPYTGCYDRDKVEKMISNLLSNAFKFTPAGGTVSLKAAVEKDHLVVEVADSGIGIPASKIGLIFNRFYQADDSVTRASEGSGIGLALTKELAEVHRGKISVSSREGIGTTFILTIPVSRGAYRDLPIHAPAAEASISGQPEVTHEAPALAAADEGKPLILVAEDNEDMQRFVHSLLKDSYRLITAANGLDAFGQAQAMVPDLIISDWMMPVMDGRVLCEKLKAHDATCHIPVLMLTARADQHSKLEGLETGADDYLIKPFDARELAVRVHNLIGQREKLRQVFSKQLILQPQQIALPSRDAVFLSRVLALLEENYADPGFGVEEFSQAVSMSRMQLHRKLKALTDLSPGDFLRRFRLERARQLLAVEGSQVSEVCFKVGFNNVSNFSKAFREFAGVTPSEFIETMAEKR